MTAGNRRLSLRRAQGKLPIQAARGIDNYLTKKEKRKGKRKRGCLPLQEDLLLSVWRKGPWDMDWRQVAQGKGPGDCGEHLRLVQG